MLKSEKLLYLLSTTAQIFKKLKIWDVSHQVGSGKRQVVDYVKNLVECTSMGPEETCIFFFSYFYPSAK